MADPTDGTTATPEPVNALRAQAYELLTTTAEQVVSDEEPEPGATTAAAETTPATGKETTAENEQVLSQHEETAPPDETGTAPAGDDGQTVPLKRLNKEVARRKAAEEELAKLKGKSGESSRTENAEDFGARDPELSRIEQEETTARATFGIVSDMLGKLRKAIANDDGDRRERVAREVEAALKDKKINLRDFSEETMLEYLEFAAQDSREKLDEWRIQKHVQKGRAEERAKHERDGSMARATAAYGWLKDEDSEEYKFAQSVGGLFPGLQKHPLGVLFIADAVSGAMTRIAKDKAAKPKAPGATATSPTATPPKVTTARAAAPLPPAKGDLSGAAKRVFENPNDEEARTKFFGTLLAN